MCIRMKHDTLTILGTFLPLLQKMSFYLWYRALYNKVLGILYQDYIVSRET